MFGVDTGEAKRTSPPAVGHRARSHEHARPETVDRALGPGSISIRLLASEQDIDETLPLAVAAHAETRHREHPLDPERRRRLVAERFLADPTRYGFLVSRHAEHPVGMLSCFAEKLYYTDVITGSCLAL